VLAPSSAARSSSIISCAPTHRIHLQSSSIIFYHLLRINT
jgi:hypothetical protein